MLSESSQGLSVRAYIATRLLAGMFANTNERPALSVEVKWAVDAADKLIAELNRES